MFGVCGCMLASAGVCESSLEALASLLSGCWQPIQAGEGVGHCVPVGT